MRPAEASNVVVGPSLGLIVLTALAVACVAGGAVTASKGRWGWFAVGLLGDRAGGVRATAVRQVLFEHSGTMKPGAQNVRARQRSLDSRLNAVSESPWAWTSAKIRRWRIVER